MNAIEVAQNNFNSWNRHDADAIKAAYAKGGTYRTLRVGQWILHGTHTGPLMDGTPPTDRKVSYPGASFVQVEGDKIRSEQTYVDRQTVAELLGLKEK
jgi:SnoaL-like polyketide cyclase